MFSYHHCVVVAALGAALIPAGALLAQSDESQLTEDSFRTILDALDGDWQGMLEYEDFQGGGRVELPASMRFEPLRTELTAKRAFAFTDPGRIVESGDLLRFRVSDDASTVTILPNELGWTGEDAASSIESWTVESLDVSDADDWEMVLTSRGFDDNRPALLRVTQSLRDGEFTSRKEVDYTDDAETTGEPGDAFFFRNEVRFTRAAADPAQLVGEWTIDLRPTPDADPYTVTMNISSVDAEAGTLEGTFYNGSAISSARLNTNWSGVTFAFVTEDGQTQYATQGTLRGGKLTGTTHAFGREFLARWSGVRGK